MPRRSRVAYVLTLGVGLSFIGCGEDRESAGGTTNTGKTPTETTAEARGKPLATVSLTENEYTIRPGSITLDRPGIYEFAVRNTGQSEHALEVEGQGMEVETKAFRPGRSAKLKADLKPGSYKLYCPVANHEQLGMTGRLTVRGARGGETTTGTTETQTGTARTSTAPSRAGGTNGRGGSRDDSGGTPAAPRGGDGTGY